MVEFDVLTMQAYDAGCYRHSDKPFSRHGGFAHATAICFSSLPVVRAGGLLSISASLCSNAAMISTTLAPGSGAFGAPLISWPSTFYAIIASACHTRFRIDRDRLSPTTFFRSARGRDLFRRLKLSRPRPCRSGRNRESRFSGLKNQNTRR